MITGHRIYIGIMTAIVLASFMVLLYIGLPYYRISMEERFFTADHILLKPSGVLGHGFGIAGTLFMIFGIILYTARKRMKVLRRAGILKHWLEFHIFLCTAGPMLVLFHTSFKFGGLVTVSFWSMVAVFASGIIGRFIYIQIPRSIEGRELSLSEVRDLKSNIAATLTESYGLDEATVNTIVDSAKKKVGIHYSFFIVRYIRNGAADHKILRRVREVIRSTRLTRPERRNVISLVKNELSLNRKIDRLQTMQNLFKYWHVAHFPFAVVMMIIMAIHVAVTIAFGYRWIF
ncbi:MAG: hypothetical protein NTU98_15305 [Bacteroidetes bacterium]|nr:hypothetical protein [Bacteroidota bacterium]